MERIIQLVDMGTVLFAFLFEKSRRLLKIRIFQITQIFQASQKYSYGFNNLDKKVPALLFVSMAVVA